MRVKCRPLSKGKASGEALVSPEPISFFGGVDPGDGRILDEGNPIRGKSVAGKILVFPRGKGSTVGSYVIYQLKLNGKAPSAMICVEADPVVVVGAIVAGIPLVDRPESFPFRDGQLLFVNADEGYVEVSERSRRRNS